MFSDLWTHFQLAQPARLLLEYTGTEYEDKFYRCGEGKAMKGRESVQLFFNEWLKL